MLAVPADHELAGLQEPASLDVLAGTRVLLLEDGHCLRDQALDVCRLAGASERRNFRATSLETLRQMVAAGVGVTLLPQLAASPPVAVLRGRAHRPVRRPRAQPPHHHVLAPQLTAPRAPDEVGGGLPRRPCPGSSAPSGTVRRHAAARSSPISLVCLLAVAGVAACSDDGGEPESSDSTTTVSVDQDAGHLRGGRVSRADPGHRDGGGRVRLPRRAREPPRPRQQRHPPRVRPPPQPEPRRRSGPDHRAGRRPRVPEPGEHRGLGRERPARRPRHRPVRPAWARLLRAQPRLPRDQRGGLGDLRHRRPAGGRGPGAPRRHHGLPRRGCSTSASTSTGTTRSRARPTSRTCGWRWASTR